jgi:hypothetical protein
MSLIQSLIDSGDCTLYHDYRAGHLQDLSGSGHHGVGNNIRLSKDGILPTYRTNGYVSVSGCTLFDATYGTMFILFSDKGVGHRALLDFIGDGANDNVRFYHSFDSTGDISLFYLEDKGLVGYTINSISVSSNRSYCVTFSHAQDASIYVDGSFHGSTTGGALQFSSLGSGTFNIGSYNTTTFHNNSIIQAVFVTKTVLTNAEILTLHGELESKKWPTRVVTNTSVRSLIDPHGHSGVPKPYAAYDFIPDSPYSKNVIFKDRVGSKHITVRNGSLDVVKSRIGHGVQNSRVPDGLGSNNRLVSLDTGITHTDIVPHSDNYTVSFWIRVDRYSSLYAINDVIGFGVLNSTFSNYISSGIFVGGSSLIYFAVLNAAGTTYRNIPGSYVNGKLHHVLYKVDHTNNLISFYVDGILQGTLTSSDFYVNVSYQDTFRLFGSNYNPIGTARSSFIGSMYNVEIYKEALTGSQIQSIYDRYQKVFSKIDDGLTASGNNSVSFSQFENSPFWVRQGVGSPRNMTSGMDTINGVPVKVVKVGPLGTEFMSMPISEFNVSPVEGSYGTWDFWCKCPGAGTFYLQFVGATADSSVSGLGYHVQFIGSTSRVAVVRTGAINIIDISPVDISGWNNFRITRNHAGLFNLYMNKVLIGSGTAATINPANYQSMSLGGVGTNSSVALAGNGYNYWYSPAVIDY